MKKQFTRFVFISWRSAISACLMRRLWRSVDRKSSATVAHYKYQYVKSLPADPACACSTGRHNTALHSYFSCVAYDTRAPRRRRRCISACDRVSAEYDRPRETRSKTTDTFPRLRCRVYRYDSRGTSCEPGMNRIRRTPSRSECTFLHVCLCILPKNSNFKANRESKITLSFCIVFLYAQENFFL